MAFGVHTLVQDALNMEQISAHNCIDQMTARFFAFVLSAVDLLNRIKLGIIGNRIDSKADITNVAPRLFVTPHINGIRNDLSKITVSCA